MRRFLGGVLVIDEGQQLRQIIEDVVDSRLRWRRTPPPADVGYEIASEVLLKMEQQGLIATQRWAWPGEDD